MWKHHVCRNSIKQTNPDKLHLCCVVTELRLHIATQTAVTALQLGNPSTLEPLHLVHFRDRTIWFLRQWLHRVMVKMNKYGLPEELAELSHMGGSRDGFTMAWSPASFLKVPLLCSSTDGDKRPSQGLLGQTQDFPNETCVWVWCVTKCVS